MLIYRKWPISSAASSIGEKKIEFCMHAFHFDHKKVAFPLQKISMLLLEAADIENNFVLNILCFAVALCHKEFIR